MTSSTPSNAGESSVTDEIPHYKLEKIILDGDLLSSSLPQLEMSSPKAKSPRDHIGTIEHFPGKKPSTMIPTKKDTTPRIKSAICKTSASSSIPLPITKPSKALPPTKASSQNIVKSSGSKLSRPSSGVIQGANQSLNKHTLEIQFLNKKKRLALLQKDLVEKQKPVLDLYQSLVQIKRKLEELGKNVCLEEIKLLPYAGFLNLQENQAGAGENIPPEVLLGVQSSIEDIPKTLMDICKNLLARRNVIVDLLESILKSEINASDLTEQIETLKIEGAQLQSHLDAVINEHHSKIKEIVKNWQSLLSDKTNLGSDDKIEELEAKIRAQEKLTAEANQVIQEVNKKLEDKKTHHDKYVSDINTLIHGLKDRVQKLEIELEAEKKHTLDYKSRISGTTNMSKSMRNKITELENDKKNIDSVNAELSKKVKLLQDQLKHKETQWHREKEELSKNIKHQENMLQRLSTDKNSFETRLQEVAGERTMCEESLMNNIEALQSELTSVKAELAELKKERDEVVEKCSGMEEQITRMGMENRASMNMVSNSINWGTEFPDARNKADEYSESMMKDIIIQEFKDKIKKLEDENNFRKETIAMVERSKQTSPTETEKVVMIQHDIVSKYKQLLAESEHKLNEKSQEVAKLTSEIRQLKVRQEHLEELNQKCPTENLQKMVEEGRNKLSELMRKSLDSEQKILHCENIIDKQSKQMNEMENLLRYRENMAGVLKASRDELLCEKESLAKYSKEMRTVLAEVTKEGKMKDRLIKELQDKIDVRERQISKLEKDVRELESNLIMTNEKRYKLQETIGAMEKELQSTKAHFNELADINTRYEPGMKISSRRSTDIDVKSLKERYDTKADLNQNFVDNSQKHCSSTISESFKVNSKSLLGLSLKQVEFLKSRVNHLARASAASTVCSTRFHVTPTDSATTDKISLNNTLITRHDIAQKNLEKIVELTAKRYDYLQKQAYESYEELTHLVKLTVSSQRSLLRLE